VWCKSHQVTLELSKTCRKALETEQKMDKPPLIKYYECLYNMIQLTGYKSWALISENSLFKNGYNSYSPLSSFCKSASPTSSSSYLLQKLKRSDQGHHGSWATHLLQMTMTKIPSRDDFLSMVQELSEGQEVLARNDPTDCARDG